MLKSNVKMIPDSHYVFKKFTPARMKKKTTKQFILQFQTITINKDITYFNRLEFQNTTNNCGRDPESYYFFTWLLFRDSLYLVVGTLVVVMVQKA